MSDYESMMSAASEVASQIDRLCETTRNAARLQAATMLRIDNNHAVTDRGVAEQVLDLEQALADEQSARDAAARKVREEEAAYRAKQRTQKEARFKQIETELMIGGPSLLRTPPGAPDGPSYGELLQEERAELIEDLYG